MQLLVLLLSLLTSGPAWQHDSTLAKKFWAVARPDSFPRASIWQALPPDSSRQAVLLRDGTEAARLDTLQWARLLAWRRDSAVEPPMERPLASLSPTLADWRRWSAPPAGGTVFAAWSAAQSYESQRWTTNRFGLAWQQSIGSLASLGGGLRWSQDISPLQGMDNALAMEASAKVCAPVVCYEARQANSSMPEAALFQNHLDSLVLRHRKGDLIEHFAKNADPSGWSHEFSARLGVLQWRGTLAPGSWSGLMQEVRVHDLPAGPVRWGLSLAWAGDEMLSGFSLSARPWQLTSWSVAGRRQRLSWEPVRMDVLWAHPTQARVALASSLHFSDPFQPGATR